MEPRTILGTALSLALSIVPGIAQSPSLFGTEGEFLGNINGNKFDPNSISNPFGPFGSPFSPDSINNLYGKYGSPYSPSGVRNRYAPGSEVPKIVAPDGTYLGDFSANPYSPNSIGNPYGVYGSPYSERSINNRYGIYGNPYSPSSIRNRYGNGVGTPTPRPAPRASRAWR